jgi:drug/metabolite transporter (DMT)-like permease
MWILYSLIAGLVFGVTNFLVGDRSYLGYFNRAISASGAFVFSLFYLIGILIHNKIKHREFWSLNTSNFYNKTTDNIHWQNWLAVLIDMVILCIGSLGAIYSMMFAFYGNINQGIITSIWALVSIYSSLIGYFVFNERLIISHFVGITMMILWIVLLSLSSIVYPGPQIIMLKGQAVETLSPAWAIIIAIFTPLTFSIRGLNTRYFKMVHKLDPTILTLTSGIILNPILIILSIFAYLYWGFKFDTFEYIEVGISGILWGIGILATNLSQV